MNKRLKKQAGITLIALIITIIVLLILAGVSISMVVGENGVLNRAQDASKKTKYASEREAIEFIVSDIKTGLMINEEIPKSKYLGEELKSKQVGGEWKMITIGDNAYGTGWYLLENGKEIEGYGKANLNWLINYNTGEVIELEEGKYSNLSSSDSVIESVRNNVIFNLDASSIGKATKVEDLEDENVDFIGFEDSNENSGLTENSFNFDGVDDYVKIRYDDSLALNEDGTPYEEDGKQLTKKEVLAKNGFTFEFYGILDGGTSYDDTEQIINQGYKGIFDFWDGNEDGILSIRFGINYDGASLTWNAGFAAKNSELSLDGTALWNQWYDFSKAEKDGQKIIESGNIYDGKVHYFTVTLDTSKIFKQDDSGSYYKQSIYLDGTKVIDATYAIENWEDFVDRLLENSNYFSVGRGQMTNTGWWHYSKMDAYTLRLYNRALTDEEIETSYNNSKLLVSE